MRDHAVLEEMPDHPHSDYTNSLWNNLTDYPLIEDFVHQIPYLFMDFTYQPSEVGERIFLSYKEKEFC